jgi:hypothetical protein
MLRFAHRRCAGLAAVAAIVAVAVAAVVVLVADDSRSPVQPAQVVLGHAARRQRRGCDHRPDFRIYTLGPRFLGQGATYFGDRCEAHADRVLVAYGPCHDVGESGCNFAIEVTSQPVCLRPRELALTFGGAPAGDSGPSTLTTLRGVPAVVYQRDTIVLMTRDTLITISADSQPARAAVDALRPAAGPHPTHLPRPDASLVGGTLDDRQCPA